MIKIHTFECPCNVVQHDMILLMVWQWDRICIRGYIHKDTPYLTLTGDLLGIFSCDQAAKWMVFSVRLSICHTFLAATKQLYKWYFPSVRPSVRLTVTPFLLCSHHRIIMKFSGVITNDQRKVHAKGQGQRSRSQRSQPNLTVSRL